MAHTHVHDHGHDDGPALTTATARRILAWVVGVLGAVALVGLVALWPRGEPEVDRESLGYGARVGAVVTSSEVGPCSYDPATRCTVVRARVSEGDAAGTTATLEFASAVATPATSLSEGDGIVLADAGEDQPADVRWSFVDVQRKVPMVVLGLVFAVVVVALGRLKGLLALLGIGFSLLVLLVFVFPALLAGSAPIAVALSGAGVIAFGTLYLAHGLNERTTVALLGTLFSLGLTALLAVVFAGAADLSGLASEETAGLLTFAPDLDFRGLLLAAVIIGALGVLDDVTVTQVAAVWELHRSDVDRGRRSLYSAGIRIGRDHIASTVNTLVLAYAAAALPLLLLLSQSGLGLGQVLLTETVAVEIVQTLVGSIGLVASVPITTALACWLVTLPDPGGRTADPDHGVDPDASPPRRRRRRDPTADIWDDPSPWGDAPQPGADWLGVATPPPRRQPPPPPRWPNDR